MAELNEEDFRADDAPGGTAATPPRKSEEGLDAGLDDEMVTVSVGEAAAPKAPAEPAPPAEIREEDSDPERERIRERRRDERAFKKQRQREHVDGLQRQLAAERRARNELEGRLAQLEQRSGQADVARLNAYEKEAADAVEYFKDTIKRASEAGDHDAVSKATDSLVDAKTRLREIATYKEAFRRESAAPPAIDPEVQRHAYAWSKSNPWYDPRRGDTQSRIAYELDYELKSEGWDPRSPEYWAELDSRIEKHLPNVKRRYNNGGTVAERSAPEASPTGGGGRESAAGGAGRREVQLPRAYVEALKEAGMWEDEKKRDQMIARYFANQRSAGRGSAA